MKKRKPKAGSIAYYIEQVINYKTEQEAAQHLEKGYPPIMAKLLLSLLIEVRSFCTLGRVLFGALLGFVIKALIFGL